MLALFAALWGPPARAGDGDGDGAAKVPAPPDEAPLEIRFLDVGQGDGVLLRLPDGKHVLIDGGVPDGGAADQLHALGVERIELLLASHADHDHSGDHARILREFDVVTYLTNGLAHTAESYAQTLAVAEEQVAAGELRMLRAGAFERGQDIGSGGVGLQLMPPPPGGGMEQNNNSIGLVVTRGAFKAVFTGDSEPRETEAWLFTRAYQQLLRDTDLYKAAHHGSNNGDVDNGRWMDLLSPDVVVICVGHNPWGHPTGRALATYQGVGARVYRTDLDGTVTVSVDAAGAFEVRRASARVAADGEATDARCAPDVLGFDGDGTTADGVPPGDGGACPASHPIKANRGGNGWIQHAPGSDWYGKTRPEECFTSVDAACASGYRPPRWSAAGGR